MKTLTILLTSLLYCSLTLAETPASNKNSFEVGIIIPLSGGLAEYGTAIRNGFEMAKQEKPKEFSNIKFSYEDSQYDGKTAVTALRKLQSLNSIDLYYLWGVSPTEATLPLVNAQQLPTIAETTVKEATVGMPFVIRAARTGERIAQALAAELEKRKVKTVSFLVTEIPFYLDIVTHLERILKTKGITVRQKEEVLASHNDFKTFLLSRKSLEEESVGVFLLPSQIITFYRQADQSKLKLSTFNADIIDSQSIVKECPDNVNGTFYTQVGVTPDFRQEYQSQFNNDVQIGSAAQAYDVAQLVSDLFGKPEKELAGEEVIERISKIQTRSGATGTFSYSETADSGREIRMPVSMKVIEDKKLKTLSEDTGF